MVGGGPHLSPGKLTLFDVEVTNPRRMRRSHLAATAVICALVLGCTTSNRPSVSPASTLSFPAVLTIHGRGNPPVIVEIGQAVAVRLACDAGHEVVPGASGTPPLPWDLRVITQGDGRVLLSSRVTELPRWIEIIGGEAGISSFPVAGPPGPSCAPAP